MQLLDDGVIFWIILKAAARVDCPGHAEPVELAHEMPRRVELILERKLGPLGERGVEDAGVRLGHQESRRIPRAVANDLAGWGVGSIFRIADGSQRGGVE